MFHRCIINPKPKRIKLALLEKCPIRTQDNQGEDTAEADTLLLISSLGTPPTILNVSASRAPGRTCAETCPLSALALP